jgi:hypothetical protein
MEALLVIGILVVVLAAGCALGRFWAPVLLALGLGAWGFVLLTSGLGGAVSAMGLTFVGTSGVEVVAAYELFGEADAGRRRGWGVGSAVLGLAAGAAALGSLVLISRAMIAALIM